MATNQKSQSSKKVLNSETVENVVENVVETIDAVEEVIEQLEKPEIKKGMDKEWLTETTVAGYLGGDISSSKYDPEREERVQKGLSMLNSLTPEFKVNPLLLLLGKWWENKLARATIKKLIDVEATEKGFNPDAYLQIELNKEIENLAAIQTAIDRLRYAKTYFKPRAGISTTVPTQELLIDGEVWIVPISELEMAKKEFTERDELKAYIKGVSTKKEIKEIEGL